MKSRNKRIAIAVTSIIAILIVAVVIARFVFFELLVVNGYSMTPTIRHEDRILVNKRAYLHEEPERGEIIAFNSEDGRILIKRVVGLPGDLIEVRAGVLYRDGEVVLKEPYVEIHPGSRERRSHRPRKVKDKHLFVMGDNRVLSVDSKDFGPISYEDVIGKAVLICFPPGRIGRLTLTNP